jgi:hypothetical protein
MFKDLSADNSKSMSSIVTFFKVKIKIKSENFSVA